MATSAEAIGDKTLTPDDAVSVLDEILEAQNDSNVIGLQLRVPPHVVESIHSTHSQPRDRLLHVLLEFLKKVEPRPTWRVVADALRRPSVNFPHLAQNIESKYLLLTRDQPDQGFTSVREKIDRFEERQTQQGLERQGPLASVKDQQIREYPNQPESRIQFDSARMIPDISTTKAAKEVNTEFVDFESALEIAHKLLQAILDNPDKYLRLKILVCGATGVGKSSLVNSFVGHNLCSVGDPGKCDPNDAFRHSTYVMEKVEGNINGTIITIWDSPGLQDGTDNEENYLQEMYDCCHDVDLVLYCVDMTILRWTNREKTTTTLLTQKFGKDFWKKCIIVLTKANIVYVRKDCKHKQRMYHEQLYHNLLGKLRQQLSDLHVPGSVCSSLPAVAAGIVYNDYDGEDTYNDRYLWYVSERRRDSSEREDFIAELWVTVFEVLKRDEYAQAKLVNITDPSRLTLTEDAKKSNAQTVKQILQYREKMSQIRMLSSAQVEDVVQQPKQNENATKDVTKKLKIVQEFYKDIPKPKKMEGADKMVVDDEHMSRIAGTACKGVFTGLMVTGAGYGAYIGGSSGIIGGPVGVVVGGAVGTVVGASAGVVAASVVKIVSMFTGWF